ncbi:ammonium transporter [Sphingomonas naasensis]|uniref:Ammonium transporter n=1 Tax=Sphingomonas naasensis TaxID=1344951 RepID=A0A4S1WD32_9SPHN|nr:ammonium transporter [Sphingomonas naasensis]
MIVLALGATFARQRGYIDQDTVLRLVIGANGLMIAWFGNRAPKIVAPSACARQITRFAGWSLVLSGLVYTGLWIFAPIPLAISLGTGVVAAGMIATLAYCLQLRARARAQAGK